MLPIRTFSSLQYKNNAALEGEDIILIEEKLNIEINQQPYTITMRTPGDEEALTRGILFTESVFQRTDKHPAFSIQEVNADGWITRINAQIDENDVLEGIHEKRNLMSVSSCGICGKFDMKLQLKGLVDCDEPLVADRLPDMFKTMLSQQKLFAQTGGCHAAAATNIMGEWLTVKEDIGRHNAVDKVIGSLLLQNKLTEAQVLLVSGRVSYEIVSKAHKAGIPFLCSVSAPSSMAIDYCQQSGITLIAFCRDDRFTVYTHAENIRY
jgi:FdhD protein